MQESGKKNYVNFKRVVWHDSFYHLLDSLQAVAKTGIYLPCADGIPRHFYPIILMLSADYEEQYDLLFVFYLPLLLMLIF